MNNAVKMPDAYYKLAGGNLHNLFELRSQLDADVKGDFASVEKSRDISSAYGDTLDRYGEMIGVLRGKSTDEQYRIEIMNRIGKNISASTCNSALAFIAQMFNVPVESVHLEEQGNSTVLISGVTMQEVTAAGFTMAEIKDMIQGILPIGVTAEMAFAGTFIFVENEGETSTETGYDYGTLGSSLR